MELKDVKSNLNQMITYKGLGDTYKLTACIIRKKDNKYVYQGEILDTKHGNSVVICRLEDIEGQ